MNDLSESARYEGIFVDLLFTKDHPGFGDIFTICGYENPNFPPSKHFDFTQFDDLQFSQIDDYFGVKTFSGEGDDIAVWLYPLVNGEVAYHHPGPFDGIRLGYNVLRNPIERSEHFLLTVKRLSENLPVSVLYRGGLGLLEQIKKDIHEIEASWRANGIEVGTRVALSLDY